MARVLKKHLKLFTKLGQSLESHITHRYSSEMAKSNVVSFSLHFRLDFCLICAQVPLGVILKCETKTEDMVSICEDLHSYVPTTTAEHEVEVSEDEENCEECKVTTDDFHYILFGINFITTNNYI